MTPEDLEVLVLETGDAWALPRALAPLNEKDRAKLSTAAQTLAKQLHRNQAADSASPRLKKYMKHRGGQDVWRHWNSEANQLASVAQFGLCQVSVLKKQNMLLSDLGQRLLDRIIRDRRPAWIDEWIASEFSNQMQRFDFGILRGWIRDGVCAKPSVDGYYQMFASHLMRTGFFHRGEKAPPITIQLAQDPALLEDIEGLFRVEHIGFNTNEWLTRGATEDHETWTVALMKLSAEGLLDRQMLLDLALAGLTRDLKQNQLSGFHGFFRQMEPTAEELAHRQAEFIGLLCHRVGHVAKFAIDVLAEIEKSGSLDAVPVMRELHGAIASQGKGNALAALKLATRILKTNGAVGADALAMVCEALRNESADVQAKALDLLEANAANLGDRECGALERLASFVAATNRVRLAALVGSAASPAGSSRAVEALPARLGRAAYEPISEDITAHQILFDEDALTPITSVDDLIQSVFHAVEIVDSPDEVERIIDGISRLAAEIPDDFQERVAPLLHRLRNGVPGGRGIAAANGVGEAVQDLLLSWLKGKVHRALLRVGGHDEPGFHPVVRHLHRIAERVARRQACPLLSAPTHRGGWIDPLVWIERVREQAHDDKLAQSIDFQLSLLRLAPDNRAAALGRVAGLPAPMRRIVEFALGGGQNPRAADGRLFAAWVTAARCRSPQRDWSAEFAPLALNDHLPGGVRPAQFLWWTSHKPGQHEKTRWKTPKFRLDIDLAPPATPVSAQGFLTRVTRSVTPRKSIAWSDLPTAALNRQNQRKNLWYYWGELNTAWVAEWLVHIWPQDPSAAYMKAATRLIGPIDENSSGWTPSHSAFQGLFQRNRPWLEPGHLVVCLGLVSKGADARGLAIDAVIEGIEGRLFDPALFAATMARLCEGEWVKFNRLGEALQQVVRVSELHAAAVDQALQALIPHVKFGQTNAFSLLQVLAETQAMANRPIEAEARRTLEAISGGGKAAKLASQLLAAGTLESA
jgi:hypothetical protein